MDNRRGADQSMERAGIHRMEKAERLVVDTEIEHYRKERHCAEVHEKEWMGRQAGQKQNKGHPGRYKTQELITQNYWWPYIQSDVRKYVDGCEACQRTKAH